MFILLFIFYVRTFEGFSVLVEKDFISFGHPFQWRCGHGYDSQTRPDNEMSPIFVQFLDCTHQLVSQFPHYFEFSTKYILVILDHVYSCRFGTFLGNCDKERVRNFECFRILIIIPFATLSHSHLLILVSSSVSHHVGANGS